MVAAASSALMFRVSPDSPTPMGLMIGIKGYRKLAKREMGGDDHYWFSPFKKVDATEHGGKEGDSGSKK